MMDLGPVNRAVLRVIAAQSPNQPLGEMAREVLSGRLTLREAASGPAYAEHFALAYEQAQLDPAPSPTGNEGLPPDTMAMLDELANQSTPVPEPRPASQRFDDYYDDYHDEYSVEWESAW
jgi:hypothetical protein